MACRGVFFSLSDDQAKAIQSANDDGALMEIIEGIEEAWDHEYLVEADKSWDAMHRLFADGSLDWNGGTHPLNRVVLGHGSLHRDPSYIVCFKDVTCVHDVARAIQDLDRAQLETWYYSKVPKDYALGTYGEEDFDYTWENFEDIRTFYIKASGENRSVIFTVDQ